MLPFPALIARYEILVSVLVVLCHSVAWLSRLQVQTHNVPTMHSTYLTCKLPSITCNSFTRTHFTLLVDVFTHMVGRHSPTASAGCLTALIFTIITDNFPFPSPLPFFSPSLFSLFRFLLFFCLFQGRFFSRLRPLFSFFQPILPRFFSR